MCWMHYLWSADLMINLVKLFSIDYVNIYVFSISFSIERNVRGYPTLLISWFINFKFSLTVDSTQQKSVSTYMNWMKPVVITRLNSFNVTLLSCFLKAGVGLSWVSLGWITEYFPFTRHQFYSFVAKLVTVLLQKQWPEVFSKKCIF